MNKKNISQKPVAYESSFAVALKADNLDKGALQAINECRFMFYDSKKTTIIVMVHRHFNMKEQNKFLRDTRIIKYKKLFKFLFEECYLAKENAIREALIVNK